MLDGQLGSVTCRGFPTLVSCSRALELKRQTHLQGQFSSLSDNAPPAASEVYRTLLPIWYFEEALWNHTIPFCTPKSMMYPQKVNEAEQSLKDNQL